MEGQTKNHPYYPRDLKIPNYIKNDISYTTLLGIFFSITFIALISTWLFSGRKNHLKGCFVTRMKICWFVACALIHGILEGYFSVNHKVIPEDQSFLGQMCKFNSFRTLVLFSSLIVHHFSACFIRFP